MTDMLPPTHNDPDKKIVTNLYAMFGVSIVLSFIPNSIVSLVSLIFFILVLARANRTAKRSAPESLAQNHATYIVRTIWIGALFSVITLSLGGMYLLNGIDYSAFQSCAENLAGSGNVDLNNPSYDAVFAASQPCIDNFINMNFQLLSISMIISFLPLIAYFGYRLAKGLARAVKGYRMADPKAWF